MCDADSQSRQIGQPAKIVTPQVAPLAGCSPLGIKPAVVSDPVETVASVPSYGEIDILTVPVNKPLIARRNQAKRILETLAVKYAGDASMTDRELSLLEDVLPAYIGKLELQIMAMDKAKFGEIAAPVISEIVSENAVASVETASADESADYTSMAMRECSIVAHPTKPAWFMVIEAGDTRGTAGETLRAAGNREHCEKWLAKIQTDQASRKAVASVEPSQPESVDLKTVLAAPTIDASKHYLFHTKPGDIAPTVNGGNIFIVGHFAKRKDARAVLQKFHDAGAHQAKIEPWLKGEKSKSMWAVLLPNVSQSLANQIAEKLALPVAEKPQGYAAPLPAGNFGEMCRSIARGVKLASVAPVRGELPEPAKPFEVANLEEKFAAGWQKSIAAGSVRPVAPALPDIRVTVAGGIVTRYEVLSVAGGTWTRGTIMQGAKLESLRACFDDLTFEVIEPVKVETAFADEAQPEPVTIKQDLSSDVIPIIRTDEAGQVINGNFREASGPVVLPPIPGRALSAMIEAGKQLAALMTAQPVPPFIGAEI